MSSSGSPLVEAKHEAERRIRAKFQERYGSFWKCTTCGAARGGGRSGMELPGGVSFWRGYQLCEHVGTHLKAGYAAPPETIGEAAILINGVIWSVWRPGRHHDVIAHYVACSGERFPQSSPMGFKTSTGRFVDRKEAHRIASAAGQIIKRCGGDAETLYSENLW
jgi:hypothetical protein